MVCRSEVSNFVGGEMDAIMAEMKIFLYLASFHSKEHDLYCFFGIAEHCSIHTGYISPKLLRRKMPRPPALQVRIHGSGMYSPQENGIIIPVPGVLLSHHHPACRANHQMSSVKMEFGKVISREYTYRLRSLLISATYCHSVIHESHRGCQMDQSSVLNIVRGTLTSLHIQLRLERSTERVSIRMKS